MTQEKMTHKDAVHEALKDAFPYVLSGKTVRIIPLVDRVCVVIEPKGDPRFNNEPEPIESLEHIFSSVRSIPAKGIRVEAWDGPYERFTGISLGRTVYGKLEVAVSHHSGNTIVLTFENWNVIQECHASMAGGTDE